MIVIPISALVLQRECKMAHFFTKTYLVVLTKMLIPLLSSFGAVMTVGLEKENLQTT